MSVADRGPVDGPGRCSYVLLAGLPGTGKSTLAAALAAELPRTVVLNKDLVRAALFPGATTDYSAAQNDLCMAALLMAADYLRARPEPPSYTLFDGRTFSRASQIEQVRHAARGNWAILHLVCPDEIVRRRLATSASGHPATDRDFALYLSLKTIFEPIQQPHLVIDTSRPVEDCVNAALEYLHFVAAPHLIP